MRQGKIFLAKRQGSHGEATWASAGGHLTFLCVSNIIAYDKHYLDVEFLGDIEDQEPHLAEPEAFSEYGWFPLDDLPQPLFEAVRYALESIKTGRHYFRGNE